MPIATFDAATPEALYDAIYAIDWDRYMHVDGTLAVDGTTSGEEFTHSKYVGLKTKDAVVDKFRDLYGRRPNVELDRPDLRIDVRINGTECTVSIDTSGDSLHKRGYRSATNMAPLNEVLAAGMVLMTGWKGERPLVDPMCGSGTLLIEAAMIALKMAPGKFRDDFGFMRLPDYDRSLWERVQQEVKAAELPGLKVPIYGFDLQTSYTDLAIDNVTNAGLEDHIRIRREPMERLEAPAPDGMIIMNPPYGERMERGEIDSFYAMIGDRFKQEFQGYEAWVLSSNLSALKRVGLKPSVKIVLFNGPLECRFIRYELYQGSRREAKVE